MRRYESMRILLTTLAAAAAVAAPAQAATTLRLDGIGPLKLGMTRAAAVKTGWLSHKALGCELARPRPVVYGLDGGNAPRSLKGSLIFESGRLTRISITSGARTKLGVTPGKTTVRRMISVYRRAGYRVSRRYDEGFRATFITIQRRGQQVLSGFAERRVVNRVSIPFTPVCE